MTQIWDEPEQAYGSDGTALCFPKHHGWTELLIGHMRSRGFWFPNANDITWYYNYGHHFFDITVFQRYPCEFGQGKPTDGIETMRRYLREQGLRTRETGNTRLIQDGELGLDVQVDGVRFWVYPPTEKFQESRALSRDEEASGVSHSCRVKKYLGQALVSLEEQQYVWARSHLAFAVEELALLTKRHPQLPEPSEEICGECSCCFQMTVVVQPCPHCHAPVVACGACTHTKHPGSQRCSKCTDGNKFLWSETA